MNILILAKDYPPTIGGVENYSYHIAEGLSEKHNVEVITFKGTIPSKVWEDSVKVTRIKPIVNNENVKALQLSFSILLHLIMNKTDVVYATTWKVGMAFSIFKKIFHTKLIIVCHGAEITRHKHSKVLMKLMQLTLRAADHLFAVSKFTKSKVIEYSTIKAEKITVIPNGIDTSKLKVYDKIEARKNLDLDEGLFIVLTVSRVDQRKGHSIILEAVASLARSFSNLSYIIVGDGPNRSSLELRAKELNIDKYVTFTGFVSHKELEYYYSASDIYIMVNTLLDDTDFEGFGLVFAEAGYYGKPLIGGNNAGPAEVIKHNYSGFLAEPDSLSVQKIVASFLKGENDIKKVGENAREVTLKNFTLEKMIQEINYNLNIIV